MSISGFGSKPDLFPEKQASVMQDNIRGEVFLGTQTCIYSIAWFQHW